MIVGEPVTSNADPTQSFTEKTEAFSQSEIDARMQSIRMRQASFQAEDLGPVHLDELVVPPDKDFRILVRPLRSRSVSPGNHENCEWLALHAEVASPAEGPGKRQHKVLAVTQTSKDIKFSVTVRGDGLDKEERWPPLWCELYYDPASDNQILLNKSDIPISLSRVSQLPPASPGAEFMINPGTIKALPPGTWRIKVEDVDVLDFRILEKRPATLRIPSTSSSLSSMVTSSGKRSFMPDEDTPLGPEPRRLRGSDGSTHVSPSTRNDDGVIEFLPPKADRLVFPLPTAKKGKELATFKGHPLLDINDGDTVEIPGGCEIDQYRLSKRDPIASTPQSSVFNGTTDHPAVPPDSVITVKVLKTRAPATANGAVTGKPHENERNVIQQADIWMREYRHQEYLQHESIVRLYGGDARYLSLYMERVAAKDLAARSVWRGTKHDFFVGIRDDAHSILKGIAGALNYIHTRNLVHNDIKPSNILYSSERGAVLCDFGLSANSNGPTTVGGTPWYVPPEFLGRKLRGPPGDVWALGITMLYVLRKLPLPESRSGSHHQRPLFWKIADLHKPPAQLQQQKAVASAAGKAPMPAVMQMQIWLGEVKEARDKLNLEDRLERLVSEMLIPNPAQRITMRRVMNELFAEQQEKQQQEQHQQDAAEKTI